MTRRKPAKKQKKSFTSYIFLIIGAAILLVAAVSWFAFPTWHAQPGGFWGLIGAAAVGVFSIGKDAIDILNNVREMENKSGQNAQSPKKGVAAVDDNLQVGEGNKIELDHNSADVSRNRQIGKGNKISVGTSNSNRSGRS
jgi:hypothetical protein